MSEILIYSIVLAFALSGELLFLAIGAGVAMHPYSFLLNVKAAFIFSLAQLIFAAFALFVGSLIAGFMPEFSFLAGAITIAFVGVKLILEANKVKNDSRTFLIEDPQILLGVSLAASFNTVLAFTGFGMVLTQFSYSPVLILAAVIWIVVLMGIFIGNKYRPERLGRFSKYSGGLILVFLAIYLLFQ